MPTVPRAIRLPRRGLFVRFLVVSLLIAVASVFWSTVAFRGMNRDARLDFKTQSDLFLIRVLDEPGLEPKAQVQRFETLRDRLSVLASQLWIVDDQGNVLASNTAVPLPSEWSAVTLGQALHEFAYANIDQPAGRRSLGVARLTRANERLVILEPATAPIKQLAQRYALIMIAFVLIGIVGICLLVLIYLRSIGKTAEAVFGAIQRGDLQRRFPVSRLDGITHVMDHFNRMADELVRLVEATRTSEQARMTLLQELSHDLRTPIAAVRGLTENLSDYVDRLSPTERAQMLDTAKGEITYMQTLLDDLFFLAEMNEPKYRKNTEEIAVAKLLEADVQFFNRWATQKSSRVQFVLQLECEPDATRILGDSRLIQRAFRNLLDNCARFATTTVTVKVEHVGAQLAISIQDDGPGLSTDVLNRNTAGRIVSNRGAAKKSLGLEIAAHIFLLHDGSLELSNARTEDGRILGAIFRVTLRQAQHAAAYRLQN